LVHSRFRYIAQGDEIVSYSESHPARLMEVADTCSPEPTPGMRAEVAALAAHPHMPQALRALATNVLDLYRRRPILNLVMNDRGRMSVSHIALFLHYTADPADPGAGLTTNRFKQLCAGSGHVSPGRAVAILALMRFAGLLAPAAASQRGQRGRLVPTEAFVSLQRDRMRQAFTAMAHVKPEGAIGLARLDDDEFFGRLMRALGTRLMTNARPLLYAPKIAFFFDRNAGALILMSLVLSGDRGDTLPPTGPVAVSVAALARRFAVSRTHVTRVLAGAEAAGLLQREATDSSLYRLTPELREAVMVFVAAVLLLVAHSVTAASERTEVRQAKVA
jgi:DNA-binding MarR family transcriptional regulator